MSDLPSDYNPILVTVRPLSVSSQLPDRIVREPNYNEVEMTLPLLLANLLATHVQNPVQSDKDRHTYTVIVSSKCFSLLHLATVEAPPDSLRAYRNLCLTSVHQ